MLKLNNITTAASKGALLIDFDKNFKEDILQLTYDRRRIVLFIK